jgi:hypothetical protein
MFFVSEEFLRKYEAGEDIVQTVDEAVPVGEELFSDTGGKRKFNAKRREESDQTQSSDS